MKKCINCGFEADENALFCEKCGFNLEIDSEYENNTKKENKNIKSKTKVKRKVKKIKEKEKKKKNKNKKEDKKQKVIIKKERTLGQRLFTYFVVILCFILFFLLLAASYYILNNELVRVPNVTNLNYTDAEKVLLKNNLRVKNNYVIVEDNNLNNIVISQNQKENKRVRKNSVIILNVGKIDDVYYLDDFKNMNINDVKNILNKNNLKYNIITKETKDIEDNIVLSQSPKSGKKMEKNDIVKLIISKKQKEKEKKVEVKETEEEKDSEDENKSENNLLNEEE